MTNEQITTAVLGALTLLVGALAAYIQAKAKRLLQDAENRNKALQIELQRVKNSGQKTQSDEKQTDTLLDLLRNTLNRLEEFNAFKRDVLGSNEHITQTIDDWFLELKELVERETTVVTGKVIAQREILEKSRHDEFMAFANEFAITSLIQQRARSVDPKVFTLPTPDHPGWTYRFARPAGKRAKVAFFNAPWIADNTLIPGVEIDAEGELVHVIENWIHGWHVVAKTKNGNQFPGIGLVQRDSVELTEVKGSEEKHVES